MCHPLLGLTNELSSFHFYETLLEVKNPETIAIGSYVVRQEFDRYLSGVWSAF